MHDPESELPERCFDNDLIAIVSYNESRNSYMVGKVGSQVLGFEYASEPILEPLDGGHPAFSSSGESGEVLRNDSYKWFSSLLCSFGMALLANVEVFLAINCAKERNDEKRRESDADTEFVREPMRSVKIDKRDRQSSRHRSISRMLQDTYYISAMLLTSSRFSSRLKSPGGA
ncbi:ADP,ATP carrier protein [Pseudozyma hubeiensis SY62]|uniref:ADP,ATP carrier protein n=1 Tax=Pseudozyma hubeiensis (strain SY62) TaxID=1305764 RepID=R9PNW9_PSEHS|nr:ADP,ATP carrier protein [Pseudozyma hubeiensis SY62]GAC99800.1 ADP,ATP carrier protein [Pseudozyma hubeiensis SY62]